MDAPARDLQNVKDKHAYQLARKRATPYRIHVLPLLKLRRWEQLIFKNEFIGNVFCAMLQSALCN
jgi:hypothetical protein